MGGETPGKGVRVQLLRAREGGGAYVKLRLQQSARDAAGVKRSANEWEGASPLRWTCGTRLRAIREQNSAKDSEERMGK